MPNWRLTAGSGMANAIQTTLFAESTRLKWGSMNKPVRSLPLKQVQEIFAVLRSLEAMAHELGHDAERGSRELSANSGDQFLRRNLVRIFAAFVEGYSFLLKQVVLRLYDPLEEQLSIELERIAPAVAPVHSVRW
jgi:hypothetical protein